MAAGEERYSTLEVDDRVQSQLVEQEEHNDSVNEKSESDDNPEPDEQSSPTNRFSNLEAYHPEYTAWNADEPAALEAYHPAWNEEDQGIIPVITPATVPAENDEFMDIQREDDISPKKRRICGVSRLIFFLLLALAITICAAAVIGAVVGTLETRAHHQRAQKAAASSSTATAPSATASPTSTSAATSATAIPTYGANVTNCNQNSFQWYAGAQDGACNQANVKEGFEVIALDGNCTVTHYSDYYCSKNATASTLYHCYDLIKSFSVDGCN